MTVACTAPACNTPVSDGYLCDRDTERLTKLLSEMPAWLDELAVTVTRQAKTSSAGGKATKKAEQPLPYNDAAAAQLEEAYAVLAAWVRHLTVGRGLTAHTVRNANDAARWLLACIDTIRIDEAAGLMLTAVTTLRGAIRRQVDNTGRRWAGPCTAMVIERELHIVIDRGDVGVEVGEPVGTKRECGADLHTRSGDLKITCRECGAVYDPTARARWIIAQSADHQDTAAFIGAALADSGHTPDAKRMAARIRQWATRDKLFAWREDDLGRPLYRVGDVLDLLGIEARDARTGT